MILHYINTIIFLMYLSIGFGQQFADKSTIQIPDRYIETVSAKANNLEHKLDRKSQKALANLQKQEAKIRKKLEKIDSLSAQNIFSDAEQKYKQLEEKIENSRSLSPYIPFLDTVSTSFKFLQQNQHLLSDVKGVNEKLKDALGIVKELESQLQKAEDIKQFLKERREYLMQQLDEFGFVKELKKINKEVYYYAQQIKEYKEILNDPNKIERKAIDLLSKTKLFQDFMKKNSVLASLFRMPGDPNDPAYLASLAGLQTRAQVNSLIQNQLAVGGPNAMQQFQQNLQAAHSQLNELKQKMLKNSPLGDGDVGGSSDDIMPEGFKPNNQRTRSFFQRVELGVNFQTQRATNFFPIMSDIGLSAGYKLNDKSIIGIGVAYKLGWGSGWNNITITHQGLGLRSFIDWKLKGSIWLSGGYEQNYNSEIKNIEQLKEFSAWQTSGLLGISKVFNVKSKLFKKTKVLLLWDFLSYQQVPRTQEIIFRIGYIF
jgi:hypothetical protein